MIPGLRRNAIRILDGYAPLGTGLRARFGGSREPELAVLDRFVRRGDTVFDVGAHRGLYSWHLSRLVGSTGTVLAFEPQPDLAAFLRRGFAGSNVTVNEFAVSDSSGSAILHIPVWDGRRIAGHATLEEDSGIDVTVKLATIDSFATSPSFIKVDVEGHENSVLQGATKTIERWHPTILLEIDRRAVGRSTQRETVVDFMGNAGYSARYLASSGNLRPVDLDCILDDRLVLDGDRDVYNFFFTVRAP